jgi:hypothetical protein
VLAVLGGAEVQVELVLVPVQVLRIAVVATLVKAGLLEMEELEGFKALIRLFKSNAKLIIQIPTISVKRQGSKDQGEQVEILIKKLVGQGEE